MAGQHAEGDAGDLAALRAAEAVLAGRSRNAVRLELIEPLVAATWRNRVLRCRVLDATADVPDTVVVKQPRRGYDRSQANRPTVGLLNEWAGLQFLGSLGVDPPLAPRFLGGDREAGLIVLEDLTPAEPAPVEGEMDPEIEQFMTVIGGAENVFFALMRRDRVRAERLLLRYAAGMGRMHAATAGRASEYEALRASLGPDMPSVTHALEQRLPQLRDDLAKAGVETAVGFDGEVRRVNEAAHTPGPFLTYTHGDACPGNDLVLADEVRTIDFELGGYGHALRDGVYAHVYFPTCGSTGALPDDTVAAMERAYRAELVKGVPEASDDALFNRAVVDMSAHWTLLTLAGAYGQSSLGRALDEDARWGRATMRARIRTRLRRFLAVAGERRLDSALADTLRRLSARLTERWPEAGEIPPYPALAPG